MKIKLSLLAFVAAFGLSAQVSQAIAPNFIDGSVFFNGTAMLDGPIATATGITSFTDVVIGNLNTGDYAGVTPGTAVTMTPFDFDPVLDPDPVMPLWTFDFDGKTFSFDLEGPINVERVTSGTFGFLAINGNGVASITGGEFLDTPGSFTFTTQGTSSQLTFSASAVVVPEPSRALLAVVGLGLIAIRRRR